MKKLYKLLLLIIFTSLSWQLNGADLEKEKRWSAQIVDSLLDGEAIKLQSGGNTFLGLFTEASDSPGERAVILLHGMGAHPDWPDVIHPLRIGLPEHQWSSLSIQLPVLANDAPIKDYAPLFDEAGPRIASAVKFLKDRDYSKIVLLGHSLGAAMGAVYLGSSGEKDINGFVAIGLSILDNEQKMNAEPALEKLEIPVLDLFGSRDLEGVLETRQRRAKAARKAGNTQYRQTEIEGADHFFSGSEDILVRTVYGWLKRNFGPVTRH